MSDSCCEGELDVQALHTGQRRVLKIVLAINVATFVMVLAAALYSGSSSLLSGGLDNFGDALTYALSLAVVGAGIRAKSRVALFKGALMLSAAVAVGVQIVWHVLNPVAPLFEAMTGAAVLNLIANGVCLYLLTPHRHADVNMASVWECSRNDVWEGLAVLGAAAGVGLFRAWWPDLIVAAALLLLFLTSAWRVFRAAYSGLAGTAPA
jgi:Co/Zn/Cd efflux system component